MKSKWIEMGVALIIAAWLAVFSMSCSPPIQNQPKSGDSDSANKQKEEVPLSRPGTGMNNDASRMENIPPSHEVQTPVHQEPHIQPHGGGHHN
jgi:hypothetical protein